MADKEAWEEAWELRYADAAKAANGAQGIVQQTHITAARIKRAIFEAGYRAAEAEYEKHLARSQRLVVMEFAKLVGERRHAGEELEAAIVRVGGDLLVKYSEPEPG